MYRAKLAVITGLALVLAGCGSGGGGGGDAPKKASASAPPAPKEFVDATASSGIAYAIGYMGLKPTGTVPRFATGGAAAGDYDNDGDVDLFITRGDIGQNLLYRNNGLGVFDEVAVSAGLAFTATATANYRLSGPIFADMDGDGDLDLFIGGLFTDPSFVYRNNGDGTFTDVTAGSGIDTLGARNTISAAFGDYDLDGDLDLFMTHYGTPRDLQNPGDTEHLWRNDTSGGVIRFTSVSVQAGIAPSVVNMEDPHASFDLGDWTFTPTFARIDDDLYPDITVTSDYNQSKFYLNNGDGTFRNATDVEVMVDDNGMGSALGDFDNDGDLDWFVSAISGENLDQGQDEIGNRHYENVGGRFVDSTYSVGVAVGDWGWGSCFLDIENDGDLDIYQTNGWYYSPFKDDPTHVWVNNGSGQFTDNSETLGLDDTHQGRGVVCADFDNDGDTDILQLNRASPVSATLWRNRGRANNYLKIKLHGLAPNTEAAGARIYVTVSGVTQMREIKIGNNFVSQNPMVQEFGLGKEAQADEVRIEWPDGVETVETGVAAGQTLIRTYPAP